MKNSDCDDVTQMSEQDPEAEHIPSSEELNNNIYGSREDFSAIANYSNDKRMQFVIK